MFLPESAFDLENFKKYTPLPLLGICEKASRPGEPTTCERARAACAQIICPIRGSPQSLANILGQLLPKTSYNQVLRHKKRLDESTSCSIFTRFWIWLSRFESYSPEPTSCFTSRSQLGCSSPGAPAFPQRRGQQFPSPPRPNSLRTLLCSCGTSQRVSRPGTRPASRKEPQAPASFRSPLEMPPARSSVP